MSFTIVRLHTKFQLIRIKIAQGIPIFFHIWANFGLILASKAQTTCQSPLNRLRVYRGTRREVPFQILTKSDKNLNLYRSFNGYIS